MSSAPNIYTGAWINHSRSTLLGATITLTTQDAAFLLALLAVVVATAGHSFWKIVSYITHQIRSKEGPQDAIFYQQQAVLKNAGTALDAAWKFVRLSFAWRRHGVFWRACTLPFIVLALILSTVFGIASIFSGQVTKAAGSAVLINSPNCEFWDFNATTNAAVFGWDLKTLNLSITAANYANTCYGTGNSNSPQCNTHIVPEITWSTNQNASCPFAEETCLLSPTAAYEMDTGQMDSHEVLGLDAPISERVTLRKVATCAPLHMSPYATFVNRSVGGGSIVDEYIDLLIGEIPGTSVNWTYEYNTHASLVNIGYDLQTINAEAGMGGGWEPIPEFNRTDADVSMFFLAANGVSYTYPNGDPWFGAQIKYNFTYGVEDKLVYEYLPNIMVTTLGCADQYQICNRAQIRTDGEMTCTPLGPISALPGQSRNIGLSLIQYSTVETIVFSLQSSNMFYSVNGRGSSALKAQNTVFTLTQFAQFPDNQWQIELDGWFAISLASLQEYLFEKASGPTDILGTGGNITYPKTAWEEAICKRQMIRNISGYQNFSTLGVAIILIVGTVLVILGFVIDVVVGWIQRVLFKRNFARLSWNSDGYLQLQRLAYEGAGYENWQGCDDDVPVARGRSRGEQKIGGLDIWDVQHPQLVKSAYAVSPQDRRTPVSQYSQDSVKMGLLSYQSPVVGLNEHPPYAAYPPYGPVGYNE